MAASGGHWKGGHFYNPSSSRVMSFEQFAAQQNAGIFSVDVATNRLPGSSPKQRKRQQGENIKTISTNAQRRSAARQEYEQLVKSGAVRAPSRVESLIRTARGHADNQTVQAARRALKKRGIEW